MIQGCVGSREAMMLHMMALSSIEAQQMTLAKAAKEAICQKGLSKELGAKLRLVADVVTGALKKDSSWFEVWLKLKLFHIEVR
ncbi:hypothetical protein Tco_0033556 [Tanacetum coccineum]